MTNSTCKEQCGDGDGGGNYWLIVPHHSQKVGNHGKMMCHVDGCKGQRQHGEKLVIYS